MAEMTVLQRSGQEWKLYLGVVLMLTGVAITARAPSAGLPPLWEILMLLGGLTLIFGAGAWLALSVRCPRCSARWLWLAATTESAGGLLSGKFAPTKCPACGYPGP